MNEEMDELLQKYILGDLSSSDRKELLDRLETDPLFRTQLYECQNISALMKLSDYPGDLDEGRKDYAAFMEKRIRKRNFVRQFFKVAQYAAIAILLIVSTWWITISNEPQMIVAETNILHVPMGQRACLTMHDGTTVWLNARSTLIYPSHFVGKERRVTVLGEAFFDVVKNPEKPFIVSIKDVEVEVKGTKFNVCSYPEIDYVETSLIEGTVNIKAPKVYPSYVTLEPDQKARIENGKMKVVPIDHHAHFLWKDGIYSFDNESFHNIIHKLELYYDVKIIVRDPAILNFTYTGKFRQRDGIDEILRIIQKIQKFKVSKNEDRSVFTLSR